MKILSIFLLPVLFITGCGVTAGTTSEPAISGSSSTGTVAPAATSGGAAPTGEYDYNGSTQAKEVKK
jgi:hypothetical protein